MVTRPEHSRDGINHSSHQWNDEKRDRPRHAEGHQPTAWPDAHPRRKAVVHNTQGQGHRPRHTQRHQRDEQELALRSREFHFRLITTIVVSSSGSDTPRNLVAAASIPLAISAALP